MQKYKQTHIVLFRFSSVGDVAMAVPVVYQFVKQHPQVKITVVSRPFLKPLFDFIPGVDFYPVHFHKEHKGIRGLYYLFKSLKKLKVTYVADLHDVLRSKILRIFFKLSGVHVAYIDKGYSDKKALTRIKNKVFKQLKSTHERYADVFRSLGYDIKLLPYNPLKLKTLSKIVIKYTGEKKENQKWIGIAPFAKHQGKRYPLDLIECVIKNISQETVYKVILFGAGQKEEKILNQIKKNNPNIINIAGKLKLQHELNLIGHLDLMVSMDSANGHFAAIYNIPVITLWGVTHPYCGFAPFLQPKDNGLYPNSRLYPDLPCSIYGDKVYFGYKDCMRSILPDSVVYKIKKIIS